MADLSKLLDLYQPAPSLAEMARRTLADKGIAGPTGAHVIEEVHTPWNLAYLTVTTGTTAFQNIVGVTYEEIPDRITASQKALDGIGLTAGSRLLITYPPLVNVFPQEALQAHGISWTFPKRPGRDGLLLALLEEQPDCVLGESTFLRCALEDGKRLGLLKELGKAPILVAAGTPLDWELPERAVEYLGSRVHDLYGCQEFGWLALDGVPLRDDILLVPTAEADVSQLVVGGLPTGDCFPVSPGGHRLNRSGQIITYNRRRSTREWETRLLAASAAWETLERTAKTVLRIKGKIVKLKGAGQWSATTELELDRPGLTPYRITGPQQTRILDTLIEAQKNYQARRKTDPSWLKGR